MKPKRPPRRLNPDTVLLIRHIIIGVMVVSFVSLLVLSVWYGTRISAFTIKEISVTGGETIPSETVVSKIDEALTGAYLGLIPKRFTFMYPHEAVASAVDSFERIKSFTLERTDFETLTVTFEEYMPDALWCDDGDTTCVFLDDTGFAFTAAPSLKGGALLRFEKIGMTPVSGVQTFTPDEYQATHELVSLLKERGWFVSRAEIDAAADAYLLLVPSGELKVSLKDEPLTVVDNLMTVLSAPEFLHIEPGNFEYIDLRFGNKVFVKEFKTVEADLASTTEAVDEAVTESAEAIFVPPVEPAAVEPE